MYIYIYMYIYTHTHTSYKEFTCLNSKEYQYINNKRQYVKKNTERDTTIYP